MFKKISTHIFISFIFLFLLQCKTSDNDNGIVVAKVNDKKLYMSDIAEIVPSNISENDS